MPSEIIAQLVTSHPVLVDVLAVVYVIGFLIAHSLRAGWPDEPERPRAVRIALALADACQLVFSAPVKMLARKAHAGQQDRIGGTD